jgi:hypothetical protein
LAGGRSHNNRSPGELRTVQREHVLDYELRRVARFAVNVLMVVESNYFVAFGEKTFSPSAQTAKQINTKRFHCHPSPPIF